MRLKSNIVFIFLFCCTLAELLAQPALTNLVYDHRTQRRDFFVNNHNYKTQADTLQLPFFDDFAGSKNNPSQDKWIQSGGTYVNNRFCIGPPTYNVVTFDGLNQFGESYVNSSPFATGVNDTLTSKYIDLSTATIADSVYLSFYYQAGGIGESPDSLTDSLWVEYKTLNGDWNKVWSVMGSTNKDFHQVVIPVLHQDYFFGGFQFRMMAAGNLSGVFDIWNVDYFYLNKNRSVGDLSIVDVGISEHPKKFLRRFSAMPFWQYFLNPSAETNDSTLYIIKNNDNAAAIVSTKVSLVNAVNGQEITPLDINAGFIFNGNDTRNVLSKIDASMLANNDSIQHIGLRCQLTTQDANTADLPLKTNDTLTSVTALADYVAYDDGSAEYGFGVNQKFAKVAQKFEMNAPDTLKALLINFTRAGYDFSNETITLRVWESISDTKDSIIWNKSVKVNYSDTLNGYYYYEISPPVLVNKDFYVGWRQLSNNVINVGFDVHNNANQHIFYTVSNVWYPLTDFTGSLMIRPLFYRKALLSAPHKNEYVSEGISVYPNPAHDELTILTTEESSATIIDMLGKTVKNISLQKGANQVSLSELPEGLYLLQTDKQRIKIAKN